MRPLWRHPLLLAAAAALCIVSCAFADEQQQQPQSQQQPQQQLQQEPQQQPQGQQQQEQPQQQPQQQPENQQQLQQPDQQKQQPQEQQQQQQPQEQQQQQQQQQQPKVDCAALERSRIVPDVITLKVSFDGHTAGWGSEVAVHQTQNPPVVLISSKPSTNTRFVLALTDPDAPSSDDPVYREWAHWVAISSTNRFDASSDSPLPYRPPTPPKGTGLHRYVLLLFVASLDDQQQQKQHGHNGQQQQQEKRQQEQQQQEEQRLLLQQLPGNSSRGRWGGIGLSCYILQLRFYGVESTGLASTSPKADLRHVVTTLVERRRLQRALSRKQQLQVLLLQQQQQQQQQQKQQ
ncbi:phosphatidylethanolamine-binding protein, putative [Eimeria maxima]|uniref:Phosphatidylethanolamine-binding protein, putative n=1 Tax=Eimeria maxima TaxID=5804 RepID=U6MA78_EIMMA|nr:phosphatidylethanolamine-binding protein, putative [Eimeria maxima]CDJ61102.1 phosphatidylethanolamine-binding protein, putative [Eimeria maxima]